MKSDKEGSRNKKNQLNSAANSAKEGRNTGSLQILDNRPGAVSQRKLGTMVGSNKQSTSVIQKPTTSNQSLIQSQQAIQKKVIPTEKTNNSRMGSENLSRKSLTQFRSHSKSTETTGIGFKSESKGTNLQTPNRAIEQANLNAQHSAQQSQKNTTTPTQFKDELSLDDRLGLEKETDAIERLNALGVSQGSSSNKSSTGTQSSTTGNSVHGNSSSGEAAVQRKLLIPDESGALKRYDNKQHGKTQVSKEVERSGVGDKWESHLFSEEDFQWNGGAGIWEKPEAPVNAENAEAASVESNDMLKAAAKGAAAGFFLGGNIGAMVGLPLIGTTMGTAVGTASQMDISEFCKAKASEEFWKMGIIAQGIELDLGWWDIPKFLSGSLVTLSPQLESITKYIQNAGSEVAINGLSSQISMLWKEAMEVEFKMPMFQCDIDIKMVDPETGVLTLEVDGNVSITNLDVKATSLDTSLVGLLKSMKSNSVATKEEIIEALKVNLNCEKVAASLNIKKHADGMEKFTAALSVDELSLENNKASLADTLGQLGGMNAKVGRVVGEDVQHSASINAKGSFENLPSLTEALKSMDVDVSGFKVANSKIAKKIGEGIAAAQEEGPEQQLVDRVLEIIRTTSSGINADGILEYLPSGAADKNKVKECCVWLIKKNKVKVSSTSWTKKGRKKNYAPDTAEPPEEKLAKARKKLGKHTSKLASRAIKSSGVDVNISGQSDNEETSLKADVHVDKALVADAYKVLDLAQTVFHVV